MNKTLPCYIVSDLLPLYQEDILSEETKKDIDEHFEKYNAKDILQQYTQSIDKKLPVYRTVAVHGPAHKPEFEIAVEWQGKVIATGKGKSKKVASQEAAKDALQKVAKR